MTLKILANIDNYSTNQLEIPGVTSGLLTKVLLNPVTGSGESTPGILACGVNNLITYLPKAQTFVGDLIQTVEHTSLIGTTYNIAISDAETYPFFYFESVSTTPSSTSTIPYFRLNSDSGSNYLVTGFESGTNVTTTATYVKLGVIRYGQISYARGYMYLKSGQMRGVMAEFSHYNTPVVYQTRWTNTSTVVTSIDWYIPIDTTGVFKLYQVRG